MATESNTGFHYDDTFGSVMGRHAISFQPGAISSNSGVIPVGSYLGSSTFLPANSGIINSPPGIIQTGNSSGSSLLLESVPGLNHDTGLAVEWSSEEQRKLDEGLDKFKDEPNIMKYIKIAATLRDKTVRDVALRCRWMQRKRRKHEEQNAGKKQGNRKDKLVESSSKTNMSSVLPQNMGMYPLPLTMHHQEQSERISSEGIIGGKAMHLLEQNVQAFNQITSNLSAYKLQDNINLFFHARNNIAAILKDMRDTPGIMSQMPPLPVSINEDLASSIMLSTPQSMMFGMPGGIHHLKQEPRC